jgi:hypothetical protein
MGGYTYSVGSHRKSLTSVTLSKEPNWVGIFPPHLRTETDPISETCFLVSRIPDSVILTVIHHRQNPSESTNRINVLRLSCFSLWSLDIGIDISKHSPVFACRFSLYNVSNIEACVALSISIWGFSNRLRLQAKKEKWLIVTEYDISLKRRDTRFCTRGSWFLKVNRVVQKILWM